MVTIPLSWEICTLKDIAKIISGGTPKSTIKENFCETGGVAWLTPADLSGYDAKTISKGKRSLTDVGYQSCSAKKMPKGSVLYSSRAPIGYVVIADNEISTNQGFKSFVPSEGVDSDYLYYYLKSIKHIAEAKATGTTFKELSGTATKTLPFIAPPTNEQKRIVEKLDSLLAQVYTIQQRLNNLPDIIKRFRQSVLAAAVTGKLTTQWREDNACEEWSNLRLSDVVTPISQGWSPKCNNIPAASGNWGVIKTSAVQSIDFVEQENKELPENLEPREKFLVKKGDILVTRAGPRVRCGVTCLVTDIKSKLMICDKVYRFQVKEEKGVNKFLVLQLNSLKSLEDIEKLKTGISDSGMNLTQKKFKELLLEWPSIEEQTEIVRLVEQYFALADSLEKNLANAKQRVDNLTQSILAKAFKGELVPQDPNDEPADKLLARIKAARLEADALEKAAKKASKAKKK